MEIDARGSEKSLSFCYLKIDNIFCVSRLTREGTGTFIARLMQSGLIPTDRLPNKFEHELHANEIVPLAYYVASMNIEGVFHELCPNEVYPNERHRSGCTRRLV